LFDAFTGNFTAHRFYYNGPKGFHFVKLLMKMDYLKSFTMGSIKISILNLDCRQSFFCASKQTYQINFPQESSVFPKVNNGERQVASRTDFYIEFEKLLPKECLDRSISKSGRSS
jgi:hypothetical protein